MKSNKEEKKVNPNHQRDATKNPLENDLSNRSSDILPSLMTESDEIKVPEQLPLNFKAPSSEREKYVDSPDGRLESGLFDNDEGPHAKVPGQSIKPLTTSAKNGINGSSSDEEEKEEDLPQFSEKPSSEEVKNPDVEENNLLLNEESVKNFDSGIYEQTFKSMLRTIINYILSDIQKKKRSFRIGVTTIILVVTFIVLLKSLVDIAPIAFLKVGQDQAGTFDF